jgi:hypothetical protein
MGQTLLGSGCVSWQDCLDALPLSNFRDPSKLYPWQGLFLVMSSFLTGNFQEETKKVQQELSDVTELPPTLANKPNQGILSVRDMLPDQNYLLSHLTNTHPLADFTYVHNGRRLLFDDLGDLFRAAAVSFTFSRTGQYVITEIGEWLLIGFKSYSYGSTFMNWMQIAGPIEGNESAIALYSKNITSTQNGAVLKSQTWEKLSYEIVYSAITAVLITQASKFHVGWPVIYEQVRHGHPHFLTNSQEPI